LQLEAICDRVLIFADGSVVSELVGDAITKASIAERCFGVADPAPAEETVP
jgi:ABC-type sugar transport system ATPase subunit